MLKKINWFFICQRKTVLAIPPAVWLVVLLLVQQSAAQPALNVWSNNGPNAYVNSVVVDPNNSNVIYAGSNSGVLKSVNNGTNWFTVNQMDAWGLKSDLVNPDTIYACTEGGVLKSTDGGVNWNTVSPVTGVGPLAVSANNPSFIYAATDKNILVTTDGGESWNTRQLPIAYEDMNLLEVDPQNPNVIYTFVTDYDFLLALFKSTNGGTSWTRLYYGGNGSTVATNALKIDSANPNIIYAATYHGVYKSTDGGTSWTLRGFPGSTFALAIDPINSGTLYAGVFNSGVYKSTDDGATWSSFNNGLTNHKVWNLTIDRTGKFLYAGTPTGIFSVRVNADKKRIRLVF
jgi:photosystem II stability/assembly factor-like uncharacterized protein